MTVSIRQRSISLQILIAFIVSLNLLLPEITHAAPPAGTGGGGGGGKPPPSVAQCRGKWTVTNVTPGMQFGDFLIDSGTGSITLTGGTARTAGGTLQLVAGASAVNAHEITITNTVDPVVCATYGITLAWGIDPTTTPLQLAGGTDITMSNVQVNISGEAANPYTLPYSFIPPTLPITVTITSQMNANFPQLAGTYTSAAYQLDQTQDTITNSITGVADTLSIAALSLTAVTPMDFGQFSVDLVGGTAILNETTGARSSTGDVTIVGAATPGTPGTFNVQGDAGLTFNVMYTNGTLTDAGGANPITISGFTDTSTGLILTGGVDSFSVGATLTLPGSHPSGNYSTLNANGAPYQITVNYN